MKLLCLRFIIIADDSWETNPVDNCAREFPPPYTGTSCVFSFEEAAKDDSVNKRKQTVDQDKKDCTDINHQTLLNVLSDNESN